MVQMIFVNLPVKDLPRSRAFFEALGYSFNAQFSNETAACLVISEQIYAMIMVHDKFREFSRREVCDTATSSEALICLSCESREGVDELVAKAVAAGGSAHLEAKDYGMMYGHGFHDLDGHIWELMWMDPAAIHKAD